MDRFGQDRLRRRLEEAQALVGDAPLAAFARLVPDRLAGERGEGVRRLRSWPMDAYDGASAALRSEVLRFLLRHFERAVGQRARQYAWPAVWYAALFVATPPRPSEAEKAARDCVRLPLRAETEQLYLRLRAWHPASGAVARSWVRHLAHAKAHGRVIDEARALDSEHDDATTRRALVELRVKAHLARADATVDPPDVEAAYRALLVMRRGPLWQPKRHDRLETTVLDAATPEALREGRAARDNPVGVAWRGLQRAGRWLGTRLGGREARLPRDEAVLASCPWPLPATRVAQALLEDARADAQIRATVGLEDTGIKALWTLLRIQPDLLETGVGDAPDVAPEHLAPWLAAQRVAFDYARAGHEVRHLEDAWLSIDGHRAQVVCASDTDSVEAALAAHEQPVIASVDAATLGHHDRVWIHDALRHEEVRLYADALRDRDEPDALRPLRLMAAGFAADAPSELDARPVAIPGTEATEAADAGVMAGGAGAGALLGGKLGAFAGPVGAVVGASLGGVLGGIAAGTGADAARHAEVCDARDHVVCALGDYATWFTDEVVAGRLAASSARLGRAVEWSRDVRMVEGVGAVVLALHAAERETEARLRDLEVWLRAACSADDHGRAHAGWAALERSGAFFHPELRVRLDAVRRSLHGYSVARGAPIDV